MKKVFLTMLMAVAFVTAKAVTATVYVKAETAPYLYGWFTINGKETKINGAWPGTQMTETVTKTNKAGEEIEFWCQTFENDASSFNIIFNNGLDGVNKQQTGNISNIASDRYFTYDGKTKYTDITEDFNVEVPDVEIQSVAILSDLNEWNGLAQLFTEVEKNAKYTFNLSLTEEQLETIEYFYRFKIMINSSAELGFTTEGLTLDDPNEWIEQDLAEGGGTNFGIDFDVEGMPRNILFTLSFAGGKDIYQGWTLSVAEGTEETYVLGDVNGDGAVDVSDYIGVANDILGIEQASFNKEAADVDKSGAIDVSDYLGVGNIIHTGSPFGNSDASRAVKKAGTDPSTVDNVIYVDALQVESGATEATLSVQMKNTADIRGFQFDMYLPEGVSIIKNPKGRIQGVDLAADRLPEDDEHTLTCSEQADGAVRFLCGSQYQETFTGNEGELMTINVKLAAELADGEYTITIKNQKLSENDITKSYETELVESILTVGNATPTGINEVLTSQNTTNVVYDLQGRRVQNASKGLYIRNGKKVVVK